jgi:EpsI family protein
MEANRRALVLMALMGITAVASFAVRPGAKAGGSRKTFSLATIVPTRFGGWSELPGQGAQVVNPQTQALLDKLYSQILARAYVDSAGYRIMLSLAYGDDQRGALQAHKPEVCYPAQGFQVHSNEQAEIATDFGPIRGRRLNTSLGQRKEPVTYWFTAGERIVTNRFDQRLVELRLALTGEVPDGLLFRVSSIDGEPARAFDMHDRFVNDLLRSIAPAERVRLAGLSIKEPGGAP